MASHPVRCGVYVVALFDLSGQSNAIAPYYELNSDPRTSGIQQAFTRIITQLDHFRKDIYSSFEEAGKVSMSDSAPENAPAHAIAAVKELESAEIKFQGFSDTVVVYVPLAIAPGKISLYPITKMLFSAASTLLTTFARGSVVRGAIDVSWAIESFDGEIYGPALMSAYCLEQEAKWPRVRIGDNLVGLFNAQSKAPTTTAVDFANRFFAAVLGQFLFHDVDGKVTLDYLGSKMRAFIDTPETELPSLIDAAHVGLETELRKHSPDSKVAGQLRSTFTYFESRVGALSDSRRQNAARLFAGP